MLYTIAAVLVLVLDQAVKYYTVSNIPPKAIGDACKTLIPGVIHMTNVQNYGAAFSIMENAKAVLIVVSVVFIIGIIMLISMDIIHTKFGRWTAVLVMAGALGNCIDRILLGYVVDMFEFELFSFAVFNVADIFITVCGILFCIHVIVYREPEEERNAVPRPEKKKSRLFARPEPEEALEDEDESGEDGSDVRRPVRLFKSKRKDAVPAEDESEDDIPAAKPRRGRRARPVPADDFRPRDLADPFAEWNDDPPEEPVSRPKRRPQAAEEQPAPRKTPRTEAPARPSRRRTAPTLEDDTDALPGAAPAQKAAPRKAPPTPVQPDGQPDGDGFDEYSLEDILAEFRDE